MTAWITLLSTQLSSLFDGSVDTIDLLYSTIENCKTFNTENTTGVVELQPLVEKALWGYMIPYAWQQSTENILVSTTFCHRGYSVTLNTRLTVN